MPEPPLQQSRVCATSFCGANANAWQQSPLQFGIVTGEMSGDLLGAGLIRALRQHFPNAQFDGIGGEKMLAAGMNTRYPMELLSVMGIVEVLGRYVSLKRCHNHLIRHFLHNRPDVFIGIDAPDFNLPLERRLKQAGIPTVHYVSPTVWAWRASRLAGIRQSCDLMLTLFPFEAAFYQKHGHPVRFVGHPLAQQIPTHSDATAARTELGLAANKGYIALLPGSRLSEVSRLSRVFLDTALWLQQRSPELEFLVPLANEKLKNCFMQHTQASQYANLPLHCLDGHSHSAMTAAEVIILASGTATLEAALLKRPMVVAYKLAPLTYWLAKRLVKIEQVSLPNLLSGKVLVPEFIQSEATAENLGQAVLDWLDNPAKTAAVQGEFARIHQVLKQDSDQRAALAVIDLIAK